MKILLIPSELSDRGENQQFLTSYLVNDCVAIDAGSVGFYRSAEEQARIRHVFLSHAHIDHTASLPILLENVFDGQGEGVTVHGSQAVLDALQQDMFNDRIWPDFIRISREGTPFLTLARLEAGQTVECENLRITPIPVDHVVPTFSFLIEDADTAAAIVSDTGPTKAIWEILRETARLRVVFVEATFPDAMRDLARVSKHLTPRLLADELGKLRRASVRIIAVHLKARFQAQLVRELDSLAIPNLEVCHPGQTYTF